MSDERPLVPDWETFERDYILSGVPHLIVVRPEPQAAIFLDQGASRLGLRFRRTDEEHWTGGDPFVEVQIAEVADADDRRLEVWTEARDLYRNFYDLATEVVTDVVGRGADPVAALRSAVARWDALLTRPALLSEESQAGLFGELWLLQRLVAASGPSVLDAWVGPDGHAHDFRIGTNEIEVKTTSGTRRIHTINGTGQLEPSQGSELYILSLKLTDAGTGGLTLSEAVGALEAALTGTPEMLSAFRAKLERVHYRAADAAHYPRRRKLRDAAVLVPVAPGTPRITPAALLQIDADFAPQRIGRVVYDIDVEGLGFDETTERFLRLLPLPGGEPA